MMRKGTSDICIYVNKKVVAQISYKLFWIGQPVREPS